MVQAYRRLERANLFPNILPNLSNSFTTARVCLCAPVSVHTRVYVPRRLLAKHTNTAFAGCQMGLVHSLYVHSILNVLMPM